jgi:hypothetical protein
VISTPYRELQSKPIGGDHDLYVSGRRPVGGAKKRPAYLAMAIACS